MCWTKEGKRYLCKMTPEQAKYRVKELLLRYAENKDITLRQAIYIYAPAFENNTDRHINCIVKNSGVSANIFIKNLTW